MKCNQAEALVPSYLDGELSEAQAGPLRKHLLDCQPCRASAQGTKNLKRWFVEEEPVAIPRDFASRVARRAFAGDRGERHGAERSSRYADAVGAAAASTDYAAQDGNLRFILQMTSLAAAALILVSLAIGSLKLPSGNKMQADSTRELKLERAIEELDRLNALNATEIRPTDARPDAERGAKAPASPASLTKNASTETAGTKNPNAADARAKSPGGRTQ